MLGYFLNKIELNRMDEQTKLIENIINKKLNDYLNYFHNFIYILFNQFKHGSQKKPSSPLNLKIIKNIKNKGEGEIFSLCLLRDGRLVSRSNKRLVIYDRDTFQPHIIIKDSGNSVCGLKNGNLASCDDNKIYIYEINGNNYILIHTLKGHTGKIWKIIELEDGRLSSCSEDRAIRIWNNESNYECIKNLTGHNDYVTSIIEINDYIISASDDNSVRVWNKYTFQLTQIFQDIHCFWNNGLSKLKENTIIIGGSSELFIVDILSFEYKSFKNKQLNWIDSILVLREDKILLGNLNGEIIIFDSLSNQIIYIQSIANKSITCIIKSEDNQIFSSSGNGSINVYD